MEVIRHYKTYIIGALVVIAVLGISFARLGGFDFLRPAPPQAVTVSQPAQGKHSAPDSREESITVYISGAVKRAGVYTVSARARINDVLVCAGGFGSNADTSSVNLAEHLKDAQQVYIPSKNESKERKSVAASNVNSAVAPSLASANQGTGKSAPNQININNADQAALESLTGIGPATAQKILAYRDEHGSFSSLNDLKKVSGIGDKKVEALASEACVK